MDKIQEAKEKMVERVKAASISKQKTQVQKDCEHDWHTYKETINIDNDQFVSGSSYFVVKGCVKCLDKRRIDLIVE